jgi:hypothetical protein
MTDGTRRRNDTYLSAMFDDVRQTGIQQTDGDVLAVEQHGVVDLIGCVASASARVIASHRDLFRDALQTAFRSPRSTSPCATTMIYLLADEARAKPLACLARDVRDLTIARRLRCRSLAFVVNEQKKQCIASFIQRQQRQQRHRRRRR